MTKLAEGAVHCDEWQHAVCALPAEANATVLGGPGTGKTTALVERVAALCDGSLPGTEGWSPDQVLVLTANRQTAAQVRDRLALRLRRTSSGPIARTVGSVAFSIVQLQQFAPVTLLTGAEHDSLLAELLAGEIADDSDGYWPSSLSRELRALGGFRTELREFVMRAEEFGVNATQLAELAAEWQQPEWAAVSQFLARYIVPKEMQHANQFDAAELVAYAARVLTDAEAGDLGQFGQLRAVLIDDAQEATESTISLLRAFARRGVAIVAFGDPDVASNGFRGGRADLMTGFDQLLGVVSARLQLHHRYRGTDRIRSEYARVVEAIGTRGVAGHREPIPAFAEPPTDEPSWSHLLSASAYTQARAIAELLRQQHLLESVPWSELAVVARSSTAALALETALTRWGVPTQRSASKLLLRDDAAARWLLDAAQLAYAQAAEVSQASSPDLARRREQLAALLASPLAGFDAIELRRLRLALRTAELDLVEAFAHPSRFDLIGTQLSNRAARAARALRSATAVAEAGTVEEVLWELWSGSSVVDTWQTQAAEHGPLAESANAALDAVVALFGSARRFVERRSTVAGNAFLDEQLTAAVPEDLISQARLGQTVTVATPSQLLGQQFHTVVVTDLIDGVWPNLRPRYTLLHADQFVARCAGAGMPEEHGSARTDVRSDEYRLFALAISRATDRVVLSAYTAEDSRPSVLFGPCDGMPLTARQPAQLRDLAAELRRTLTHSIASAHPDQTAAAALAQLARHSVAGADPAEWYGVREWSTNAPLGAAGTRDGGLRVSPSAIEKLEQSSLAWFVDSCAPAPSSPAQSTGVIVHAALEQLGGDPSHSVDEYLEMVLPQLAELPVEAEWMREPAERRVRAMLTQLCQYLADAANQGRTLLAAEAPFVLQRDGVTVKGVIDRVEQSASGDIFVVDLKTGSIAVSGSDGEASAQLQCYQLAIHTGAVDGVAPSRAQLEGAALLYVNTGTVKPVLRTQPALTAESAQQVWQRIADAATAMQGPHFLDYATVDDRGPTAARRYRIQMVAAVSAP